MDELEEGRRKTEAAAGAGDGGGGGAGGEEGRKEGRARESQRVKPEEKCGGEAVSPNDGTSEPILAAKLTKCLLLILFISLHSEIDISNFIGANNTHSMT